MRRAIVMSVACLLSACDGGSADPATAKAATGANPDEPEQGSGDEPTGDKTPSDAPVTLSAIAPSEPHPFSAKDMWAMERISGPTLSPDGTQLVYVLRSTDIDENRSRTDLWLQPVSGGEPTRLTDHPEGDFNPVWAADSKTVYFLSTRSESSQIWKVAAAGGAAEQVSEFPVSVSNLAISPDGSQLAFSAEIDRACTHDLLNCAADKAKAAEDDPRTGVGYDRIFVRHWDHWKGDSRSRLFTMKTTGGVVQPVSLNLDADVPSKPFGGPEEFTFSPDGQWIVFAARDAEGKAGEPNSTNFDLYVSDAEGARPAERLTENPAWDTSPVFSPDGKKLAWTAMARPGFEADRFRIVVQDFPDGEPKIITEDWDRSVRSLAWSPEGTKLLVTAQDLGQVSMFEVDATSGEFKGVHSVGTAGHAQYLDDERIVFTRHDLQHPAELFTIGRDGKGVEQLSHINDERIAAAQMGEYEQFSFTGAKGDRVYGYVVKPANFDPAQKYPVAFLIHGGPQGSFGNKFHYRWNPQAYAGAGYVSVMIDFHGSTGYGQKFTDSISGDWGGAPLEDLKKGLAHVEANYDFVDGERVCALGASYGGYMINWIAGQWPDRFDCLVNHDGIFDQRLMYYATEELWFPEWEHGGPYYERAKAYEKHNPANYVDRWKTPMLVIHGSLDYRVGVEQGIATFTALQRRGIESRLLHYPDENHWVLKPHNGLQWHDEVFEWLDAHLQPSAGADAG